MESAEDFAGEKSFEIEISVDFPRNKLLRLLRMEEKSSPTNPRISIMLGQSNNGIELNLTAQTIFEFSRLQ